MPGLAPVYSTTFLGARITSASSIIDYTVPANMVAVIDSVTLVQDVGNVQTIMAASVDPTGSGSFVLFYSQTFVVLANANSRGAGYFQGRIVVRAGGKIRLQTLAGTNGYGTCSGFLLQA